MNSIERRIERVEAKARDRAGDLSLLSDEELDARLTAIVDKALANREATIQEFAAMAPAELAKWKTRHDSLSSALGDRYGAAEISELVDAAMDIQAEGEA